MPDVEQAENTRMHIPENWSRFTLEAAEELLRNSRPPAVGYLIWTRSNHGENGVRENIDALAARRIKYLRTGISWAEWMDSESKRWISWYIREYAKHFNILPCLSFTPPELGREPRVNAPPRNIEFYARFVDDVLTMLGDCFGDVELWNEWNLNTDWDPELDPTHEVFSSMIALAANVVKRHGKRIVLGGPSKVNEGTLGLLSQFKHRGLIVDVLGFHNLRGTWSDQDPPPPLSEQARLVKKAWREDAPVWLTEYGFPVADPEHRFDLSELEKMQVALFAYAVHSCLEGSINRMYWYTYKDEVHHSLRFVTTGWEDVLQFYYGDTQEDGTPRLLSRLLCNGGPEHVLRHAVQEGWMHLVEKASLKRKLQ